MSSKKIEVSIDDGTTWRSLPGTTGSYNEETEASDDTIFGEIYQSSEVGLISWTMSANAYFKGFPGFKATLKRSGVATAMSDEACTRVGNTNTYQVTAAAKRVLDTATAITAKAGGSATNVAFTVDYLFGRITFASAVTGAVTITGKYFPVTEVANTNSFTLTMTKTAIDNTTMKKAQDNDGHREYQAGLRTVSLDLTGVFGSDKNLYNDLIARNQVVIEVKPAGDANTIFRGFFKFQSAGQSGDVGALEEQTLTANLTVPVGVSPVFSYLKTSSSTLPLAVEDCLKHWFDDDVEMKARYLPSGEAGQTPLDGRSGDVIITDLSLSGGLAEVNTFAVEMQGSGGVTAV